MSRETPETEADGAAWRPFIPSGGGLKVDLPSDPAEQEATSKTGVGRVKIQGFRCEHQGAIYLAAYSELHPRLDLDDHVKVLDAPLDHWVTGAGRRKPLGERLLPGLDPDGPREADFALPSRKGGEKWIARRRWIQRGWYVYQAIVVSPERLSDSADSARFLGSLEAVPIVVDRRGLTPAWTRKRSKDDGFTVLWPDRFDDALIRVVTNPSRSAAYSTYFVFQRSMGFAVTVARYHPPSIMSPIPLRIEPAEVMDDVRDRFLSDYHAELLGEQLILRGGLAGRQFEAKFTDDTQEAGRSVRQPPGPGVERVTARLYAAIPAFTSSTSRPPTPRNPTKAWRHSSIRSVY